MNAVRNLQFKYLVGGKAETTIIQTMFVPNTGDTIRINGVQLLVTNREIEISDGKVGDIVLILQELTGKA